MDAPPNMPGDPSESTIETRLASWIKDTKRGRAFNKSFKHLQHIALSALNPPSSADSETDDDEVTSPLDLDVQGPILKRFEDLGFTHETASTCGLSSDDASRIFGGPEEKKQLVANDALLELFAAGNPIDFILGCFSSGTCNDCRGLPGLTLLVIQSASVHQTQ